MKKSDSVQVNFVYDFMARHPGISERLKNCLRRGKDEEKINSLEDLQGVASGKIKIKNCGPALKKELEELLK